MRSEGSDEFHLATDIVMLNHASYGLASRRCLAAASQTRMAIERDPTLELGAPLRQRLGAVAAQVASAIGANPSATALTSNATEGSAALSRSLVRGSSETVVMLTLEYSSVIRGWSVRAQELGSQVHVMDVRLPLRDEQQLLDALKYAPRTPTLILVSLISSSTSLRFPVEEIARWGHSVGALVIVDAAHGVGHVPVNVAELGADAVFGSLHKWLPVPRSVGYLWVDEQLQSRVRPCDVSLAWDETAFPDRFGWRGTWDPAPPLTLTTAFSQWRDWQETGLLKRSESLSDSASALLTAQGLTPTGPRTLLPPRMRSFLVEGVDSGRLRRQVTASGIRAWVGLTPDNRTLLRVSTHIYNEDADIEMLAEVVARSQSAL